ncbi:hypothetical protein Afil01_03870 [Actinorhabdospora filicis]|uniref:Methyltransferase domain-containing protein n=1 Tax=Actinorhabdospora filicis TaxID=1785913 RepID=A0A9W6SE70_9ACTN|nr:methyltransferase domain-containing protein [Actinorhabdospora filicis]GLZ75580.1 hypothetical protein Afil01_03870 [Actinorhabdospora filicis]
MQTRDAQLLVLSALADGPMHGYALNAAIERIAGSRLGESSLYSALNRLRAKGFVEFAEEPGRRRPARLTAEGHAELARGRRAAREVFEAVAPEPGEYLRSAAASAAGRSYKEVVMERLELGPGLTVADLGCGAGADLAAMLAAGSAVIGVDIDPAMLARAAEAAGPDATALDLVHGDLHELPLPDASVDRARTDRVVQHVAEPGRVLAEAWRVLRPGGRLVMGEPDWDSLAIDHPERDLARRYARFVADRVVRNATIGRELPRLAAAVGFEVADVTPVTPVFRDRAAADAIFGFRRVTTRAVEAGYFVEPEAERWLDHLATGPFLAAMTMHVVTVVRPD